MTNRQPGTQAFSLDSYNTVPERIAEFKAKHPDGCLRPVNPLAPFSVIEVAGKTFVVYAAAAYRSPEDPMPGIGVAWEPFPGPTPYTKDSELMNAETSAWGRALVAVLAADTKKGIACREDVQARDVKTVTTEDAARLLQLLKEFGPDQEGRKVRVDFARHFGGPPTDLPEGRLTEAEDWIAERQSPAPPADGTEGSPHDSPPTPADIAAKAQRKASEAA